MSQSGSDSSFWGIEEISTLLLVLVALAIATMVGFVVLAPEGTIPNQPGLIGYLFW